jgi:hypothetical protein
MVPLKVVVVNVTVSIDPTIETDVLTPVVVNVPLASANRPVPPEIVLTTLFCTGGPRVPVPEVVVNSLSPFAATVVPVPVKLNPFGPTRANCASPLPVIAPRWEIWPEVTLVPAPVIRLTVVVDVVVPVSGRLVPFAAAIAAVGLMATTASTKPERKTSLRSGIPATPFSVRSTLVLLAHRLLVAHVGRNGVAAGVR